MANTKIKRKYLEELLIVIVVFIFFFFQGHILISSLAMAFAARSIYKLLRDFEDLFPVVDLIISLCYLQLVVSAFFVYQSSVDFTLIGSRYAMWVPEFQYMTFILLCLICTELGLKGYKHKLTKLQIKAFNYIEKHTETYQTVGLILFFLGIITSLFSFLVPSSLRFAVFLIELFPYVGFFYLWVSMSRLRIFYLITLLLFLVNNAFSSSMFIDFFIWLIYISSVILFQKKISIYLKLSVFAFAFVGLMVIQVTKMEYRKIAWNSSGASKSGVFFFFEIAKNNINNQDFWDIASTSILLRINQGFLLSSIMEHTDKTSLKPSQIFKEVLSIPIPRFLYPNKPVVNSRDKFLLFSGRGLSNNTAMSVGIHGDAYANFGHIGGLLFLFMFYYISHRVYVYVYEFSKKHPSIILWIPFLFFYSIRPGAEFLSVTNWLVKSLFVVFVLFVFMEYFFQKKI